MKPHIRKVGYFWYVYQGIDWQGCSISWRGALEIAAIYVMRRR